MEFASSLLVGSKAHLHREFIALTDSSADSAPPVGERDSARRIRSACFELVSLVELAQ